MTRVEAKRKALPWIVALDALFFAGVLLVFYREAINGGSDLAMHASIAGQFDFSDLHSITCRIAYPLWHILVAALFKLGLPLAFSAALVTACFKTLTLATLQCLLLKPAKGSGRSFALLASFAMMLVTGLCLLWFNPNVYRGVGSPNVWHNPTQVAVTAMMFLCLPYLMRCYGEYERRLDNGEARIALRWRVVLSLAALLGLTLACKPTFMQALLPAAFVLFLVEWLKNGRQWRFFMQLVLAFLPSVAYFLLQYLYYTGVLVEYTSGVSVWLTGESLWIAVRSALVMAAFPLLALACRHRRGQRVDRAALLGLLMLLFSVLEATAFHETGVRLGHGNFTWSTGSSALYLWYVTLSRFWDDFVLAWQSRATARLRLCGYAACWALLLWHFSSGIYYLCYLLTTGNAF